MRFFRSGSSGRSRRNSAAAAVAALFLRLLVLARHAVRMSNSVLLYDRRVGRCFEDIRDEKAAAAGQLMPSRARDFLSPGDDDGKEGTGILDADAASSRRRRAMRWYAADLSNSPLSSEDGIGVGGTRSHEGVDSSSNCRTIRVLLTKNDTDAGLVDGWSDFSEIKFGTTQGGKILLSNPDNSSEKIGSYTVLTTFLSPVNLTTFDVDCYGNGAYRFGDGGGGLRGDDGAGDGGGTINFASSCTGRPYLTLVGGQGSYLGAYGYSEFMIPHPDGFVHEIYVCTRQQS